MLREAKEDLPDGIYIRFPTDDSLFNLRHFFTCTKTIEELHKDPSIQGRRRSHPSVRCRDLDSLSEADQATCVVSPTLLALHPWHQMARLHVK